MDIDEFLYFKKVDGLYLVDGKGGLEGKFGKFIEEVMKAAA